MSKIITKQEAQDCQSWVVPNVNQAGSKSDTSILTAKQLEELQQQAHDEAFKEGFAEGMAAGKQAAQNKIQEFNNLLNSLSTPFKELDNRVDEELVVLVKALVKQMIRREIKTDPGQVMAVIREAIESLPVATRQLQIRLHPEDASLVNEFYSIGEKEQAWDLVEDPLISRGGCRVITAVTQVDATLETRLNQLFAQVFGERQKDADE